MSTGRPASAQRTHEASVLRVLRERGALSRGEIAELVGVSRTTLSDLAGRLLDRGAIIVADTDASSREGSGRPAELLALDPGSGQFMGVDFSHREVHVAVADASHEIIASGHDTYTAEVDWHHRLAVAFDLVDRISQQFGAHYGALRGVAIGVPGHLSLHTFSSPDASTDAAEPESTSRHPGPTARSRGVAGGVAAAFAERFGAPVIVDNNTRFAALAEALGSGRPVDDLIYVRLADGIGGGLVVGGRLVTGSAGLAGELGHVNVDATGAPCRCGKNGCLETVASVPAILSACRAQGVPVETLDGLAAAVSRSHPVVDGVLRRAGAAVGRVVATTAMGLNPSEIVIGGEVTRIAPVIVDEVRAAVAFEMFPTAVTTTVVRSAHLAHEGGAIGGLAALFHSSPLLDSYPETPTSPPAQPTSAMSKHHEGVARVRTR